MQTESKIEEKKTELIRTLEEYVGEKYHDPVLYNLALVILQILKTK